MRTAWVYAGVVLALYVLLLLGIPLASDVLAEPAGGFNRGMLLFVLLHTVPVILAGVYLRQRRSRD